jgi:hypothetical protein
MLKKSDEEWLRSNYQTLIPTDDAVTGIIEFTASYNRDTNRFVVLGDQITDDNGAVTLSGNFEVRIEERRDKSISQLPALHVERLEPIPERHFNQKDNSACLCSPLEEREFLQPELQFRVFLEQLVIPFLYGQVFYSSKGRWPWAEYAHGAAGILEAYSKIDDQDRAEECIRLLAQDVNWPRIRSALRQQPYVKGRSPCFCAKRVQIIRCHPRAFAGALRLQKHLRALKIPVS